MSYLDHLAQDLTYGILCAWAQMLVTPRSWQDALGDCAARHGLLVTQALRITPGLPITPERKP